MEGAVPEGIDFFVAGMPRAPGPSSSSSSIPTIVGVRVPAVDIDPQAVINALSQQIGALQTENTILKMALQQVQAETEALHASAGADESLAPIEEIKKKK